MLKIKPLRTTRLTLREWRASDREPFACMNADARVMEFLPAPLTRAESDALADRIEAHFREHGFGLFAAELRAEAHGNVRGGAGADNGAFIGWIGLSVPRFEAHFTPCVEIGWRLAADYWGRGVATEGARAVARHAFAELGLDEIVSFTVAENVRSTRVMQKLGMTRNPGDDFDHPALPPGHPLRRHVLYRLQRRREK
jgi:ribosomal-protein-alanine N-acetyltransferase